ncbi:MAG: hypothetical protein ACI8S6_003256 [Myxococcota bacterium]|jgi:hypothetical protein
MFQLQPPGPLSASLLWTLQQRCYAALGMSAWQGDRTPSYITSNPHFAESTAHVLLSVLLDLGPQPEPIPIIELGAGSGRFSWLLLEQLSRLAAACPLPVPAWRLIMTDTATSLLRSWQDHPQLSPHARSGRLDFARFDVSAPRPLRLRVRDEFLPAGPRIILANYLWDSVPQDAYEVGDGETKALHVGLLTEADPTDMSPTALMGALRLLPQPTALPADLSPALAGLLGEYAARLSSPTTVLAPVAADACLGWFARSGPVIALSADKGVASPSHIVDGGALPITLHGGTASLTVDFCALAALVSARGGWSRAGDTREPLFLHHLDVIGLSHSELSRGLLAFDQAFGPGTGYDLYRLGRATADEGILPSVDRLLSMLGLTRADPDVLWVFSQALDHHIEAGLGEEDAASLRSMLSAAAARVYRVPGDEDDIDAVIAQMAAALSDPQTAAAAWAGSIARRGPSPEALHGRAVALSMLGEPDAALAAIQEALTLALSHEQHAQLSQWASALSAWRDLS